MMKKTKKIQQKIMVCMSVTLLISLVITGILTTLLNYNSILDTLEQTMSQSVYTVSERVREELIAYGNISAELGHHETLSSDAPQSKKEEVIDFEGLRENDFIRLSLVENGGKRL